MDATLERIEIFSTSSNIVISRAEIEEEKDTAGVPVNQVRTDTATSVTSSVTASARKAPSIASTVNTPQSKQKDTEADVPNPVTPNVRRTVTNEGIEFVTKMPVIHKESETQVIKSQETTAQTHDDENLFNLGTMPASDDTELQNMDNSLVRLNREVLESTGILPQIHGNHDGDVEKSVIPAHNPGTARSSYKDIVSGDTAPIQAVENSKEPNDEFVPITKGIQLDTITDNKSAESKKSENTNSYALLDFEDVDDDDVEQNRNDNQDASTDDEEKSTDLLFQPNATMVTGSKQRFLQKLHDMARTPTPTTDKGKEQSKVTEPQKTKKKQEPLPAILKIPDKKAS